MADEVIRRQGSATDHQSFTGAAGEITVENTNWNLRIHDGSTAGGHTTLMDSDRAANGGTVAGTDRTNAWDTFQDIHRAGTGNLSFLRFFDSGDNEVGGLVVDNLDGNGAGKLSLRNNDGVDLPNNDYNSHLTLTRASAFANLTVTTSGDGGLSVALDESDDLYSTYIYKDGAVTRFRLRPNVGIYAENATGGHMGAGTSNFEEVYDNGNRVATSDYVFDADQDGEIDTDYYDSVIGTKEVDSDTETEEVEEEVQVTETVEDPVDEWCPEKECYERKMVPRERPVYDEYEVRCPDTGKRLGTKRVPRKEKRKVQRPKRVEVQLEHKPARRFEHDDLDPAAFAAKCQATRKLPAMDRCEQHLREGQERPSLGEWVQAMMETCEAQAVHIEKLRQRIDALESK